MVKTMMYYAIYGIRHFFKLIQNKYKHFGLLIVCDSTFRRSTANYCEVCSLSVAANMKLARSASCTVQSSHLLKILILKNISAISQGECSIYAIFQKWFFIYLRDNQKIWKRFNISTGMPKIGKQKYYF